MKCQRPEPELLEHLIIEFGDHGKRAVDFLSTAQNLLEADQLGSPRLGETVAYCLREAMQAIPASLDTGGSGQWKKLSREVVDTYKRYKIAEDMSEEGISDTRNDLYGKLDDLKRFHDQPGLHEKRLIALISRRTGVVPLSTGTAPVRAYQNLLTELNKSLHGRCSVADSRQLWYECLNILRQFFLPPEIKHTELESLAQIERPSAADRDTILKLVANPNQLRHFLSMISSPEWLQLLEPSGILNPSDDLKELWPAHAGVVQLATNFPTEVLSWLDNMYDKHGSNSTCALYLAQASLDVGEPDFNVVHRAMVDHPDTPLVLELGIRAVDKVSSSDQLVELFADVLLNEVSWEFSGIAWWLKGRPMEQFSDGVNASNAKDRVVLLCQKIRSISGEIHSIRRLEWDVSGSIADQNDLTHLDRFTDLLSWLVATLKKAWEFIPPTDILSLDEFQKLPERLIQRLRAWILGNAPSVEPNLLVKEIEQAITSRYPTGDDLAVIDRVLQDCEPYSYTSRWREALGPAPQVKQVGVSLSTANMLTEWSRVHQWVSLCPPEVAGSWSTPCEILSAEYGSHIRESLERRTSVKPYIVGSPFSAESLSSDEPEEVAEKIADWKPDSAGWRVGSYQLAQTLESVVKENIGSWVSNPMRIVTKLRHPIYIHHYLRAVATGASDNELPVQALLDVIALVRTHPWPIVDLGDHSRGIDWRETNYAAVDLIKALAQTSANFEGRADEVWNFLEAEALDRSEASRFPCDQEYDPRYIAINRPCTRALEAVFSFAANEFRTSGTIRSELIDLLEFSLRLKNPDGAEYRAILAPRIGFLRHILPNWMEENRQLIFGAEAPDSLGQITIDMALRWGQPDRWLLENYPEMIRNSVEREVDRALDFLLLAMFWELKGYSIDENVDTLQRSSEHAIPKVGGTISQLLGADEVNPQYLEVATNFWKSLIDRRSIVILRGFGWMAKVEAIDFELWADLTLQTLKVVGDQISPAYCVAERIMALPLTEIGLDILNRLVRGDSEEWDRLLIIDKAEEILSSAEVLKETNEYKRLRTTLIERGVINARIE